MTEAAMIQGLQSLYLNRHISHWIPFTLEFPTYNFDFHLLTSVNAKYFY